MDTFKVVFVGDVVGKPGRRALHLWLEENRRNIDFCIVNGENAAAGFGITEKIVKSFISWGVDAITLGNHTWDKKEIYDFIGKYPLLRPANYPDRTPGKEFLKFDFDGFSLSVLSIMGRVFMECLDNPFRVFDKLFVEFKDSFVIVDFHGEATSEKQAFGFYVDGRAGAVLGTHTHVQTTDLRLLPRGTLYITDVGMTGAVDSVIGMEIKESVDRFVKQLPVRFKIPEKPEKIKFSAITFEINKRSKKVVSFERVERIYIRGDDGNYS
ncbi:TIGR00282 family metallophosphoesterase [Desulfurobacterium atlanticum]|uniref:TIGR00282 family metallophosphoesterase n=1 Tax=Desulfurobacterium atlanticum TaxID=240169 RepID=A0A238XIR9_9BACT|nr:TIGR00282 family metallophosphoesterase [Desulfurobacterium atlanticum]SNR58478.1 hypothetical protein SAMN06265340_1011 [Desulfurobacterium atlanticum]